MSLKAIPNTRLIHIQGQNSARKAQRLMQFGSSQKADAKFAALNKHLYDN